MAVPKAAQTAVLLAGKTVDQWVDRWALQMGRCWVVLWVPQKADSWVVLMVDLKGDGWAAQRAVKKVEHWVGPMDDR